MRWGAIASWHRLARRHGTTWSSCFSASSEGAGYYALYLDGQPVEVRLGVSMIRPGSSYAQAEIGLFRDGDLLPGTSQIWVDAVTLGETLGPVALP